MSRTFNRSLALGSAVALAGCALGPDFRSPAAPAVERYTAQPLAAETASAPLPGGEAQRFLAGRDVPAQWWKLFGSPKLDALIDTALRNSPTVASAQAALRQAQENLRAQTSTMFPYLDASGHATRQKIDTSSFGNPNGGTFIYNLYNASVNLSYGLDLWGGTRRGVEASRAVAEAQAWQAEATYQTLIANIITAAVAQAEQQRLLDGQVRVIADQQRLLTLAEQQYGNGAIGRSELQAARQAFATEQAKLPPFEIAAARAQNQLATYAGRLPAEQPASAFELEDFKLPLDLPIALPSTLVRQRPDVRAAEAQFHQAAAEVGIATANLLPQITLTATLGTQASTVDKLFDGNIFSIGASITQPLLHAGELSAKRRAALAAYDRAAADYRQTVLLAFENVADTLRALETDAETLQAQVALAAATGDALALAKQQYALGGASLLTMLNAQQADTKARAGYVAALAARMQDSAALFQALGGGWRQDGQAAGPPPAGAVPAEAGGNAGAP